MKRDEHFKLDLKKDKIELTDAGRHLVRYSKPPSGEHSHAMDKLIEAAERSCQAHYRFLRDQHYMINDENKVIIIDEGTGRPMPDRHWRDGLHQAIEAKEAVQITVQSDHAAQITYQNFYKLYAKLAGMSGTLLPNFWEMRKVYRRWVTKIPTNRPIIRQNYPDRVFPTEDAKFAAVVEQVQQMVKKGRPVLIGTRTVDKSERLSKLLTAVGIEHRVLNARQDKNEAEVVSQAGQPGRVTVATNMAGRGTDIKLGKGVADAGGLHVIGTERHEAERIDRQLAGRAGRQGDPGSSQFFLCLEDQLLEGLGISKAAVIHRARQVGLRETVANLPTGVPQSPTEAGKETPPSTPRPHELRQAAPGNAAGSGCGSVCGLGEFFWRAGTSVPRFCLRRNETGDSRPPLALTGNYTC